MEKNQDTGKRGGSNGIRYTPSKRQSRTSGPKLVSVLNGRDVDVSDKSRRLTTVQSLGKANEAYSLKGEGVSSGEDNTEDKFRDVSEMGGGFDGEEDVRPASRRFKARGKAFDDCSAVDPAAVPRKLRSAVNKRGRESISPPLPDRKKHQHAPNVAELATTAHPNGLRRSKQNLRQSVMERCSKQVVSVTVTKDEVEVAETLFALARMVPQEPVKSELEGKVEEKTGSKRSFNPPEASKEKHTKSELLSAGAEASDLSPDEENSAKVPTKIEPQTELTVLNQPSVSVCQKLDIESYNIAQADLQRVAPVSGSQQMAPTSLTDVANSFNSNGVPAELCSVNGLLTSLQAQAISMREPENGPSQSLPVVVKQEEPIKMDTVTISRLGVMEGETPDIWPRLSSSFGVDGHHARSSSTKSAPWPDSTTSATRPGSTGNNIYMEKLSSSVAGRQSWKRCAAHVYISHRIHAHQSAGKKLKCQALQANQSRTKGGKPGSIAMNDLPCLGNGLSNIMSNATNAERSSCDTEVGILPEKRLLQDQQARTASGIDAQQKQNCEFLSLSAAGEPNNSGRSSNGIDSSCQLHAPFLHSFVQHHPVLPFSLQTAPLASAYLDQLAAAQQMQWQLPQYLANPFYGAQLSSGATGKQQQQMWAAQLAQQYPPVVQSSHFPKWQNGLVAPCSQTIISASPTLEAMCAKYSPGTQQFYAVPSPSSTKR